MLNTAMDHAKSELLLIRYRRGDSSALDELVRLWQDRLFYYIRRLVSDEEDAWDAVQETWLSFVKNVDGLRDPSSLVMWLYKIARHKAMDRMRRRYRDQVLQLEDEDVADAHHQPDLVSFEDAQQVHSALGKLSVPHREVLTLFFLEDLSVEQIAEVVGVAVGTVKSRLHFARKAIRSIIETEEEAI